MFKTLKKLVSNSPLLQVTSFNSLSISIKLISDLVVAKLSAVLLGAQGVALIGNLRNILSVFHNFSSGGLDNAVVKYTGEFHTNHKAYQTFISTLFWVFVGLSLVVFSVVFIFSKSLSGLVFNDVSYAFVFKWTALLLPLYALNVFMLGILKGLSRFKKVIRIHILSHFLNLILFAFGVLSFGLSGALMAVVAVPSFSFFISLFIASKHLNLTCFSLKVFSFSQLKNFG
ncbi:polysaccharide biosynthesis C-terminal domain-containing protein [Flavobacterium sp. CS20]|uniref:polysaccharide biosynthesis C-terminal domain-containing protein n=1 Tax=Flavobacterium sp. CS20 TaxID=2775246 RepID=UPI001FFD7ECC|nr:polysaccharide biosynthesis C-terminal domain-containing protein [Flavobacterium sp. CS20]